MYICIINVKFLAESIGLKFSVTTRSLYIIYNMDMELAGSIY